jgi:uncharacterized protein with HEPN domain
MIGEAAAGVSDELVVAHPEVAWRQMIAMRNRVVHAYFDIDLDILWHVVTLDIPKLATQIAVILNLVGDA